MRPKTSERGDAMAWMAIIMVFLMVPLMGITIDITRAMYVRGHLQAASDAACQAAADAMMVPLFMETGEQRIDEGLMYGRAAQVFNATLKDSGKVRFMPALSLRLLTPTSVECTATASVDRLLPSVVPEISLRVSTVSEMRAHSIP
jgi:hypothetical protein